MHRLHQDDAAANLKPLCYAFFFLLHEQTSEKDDSRDGLGSNSIYLRRSGATGNRREYKRCLRHTAQPRLTFDVKYKLFCFGGFSENFANLPVILADSVKTSEHEP